MEEYSFGLVRFQHSTYLSSLSMAALVPVGSLLLFPCCCMFVYVFVGLRLTGATSLFITISFFFFFS